LSKNSKNVVVIAVIRQHLYKKRRKADHLQSGSGKDRAIVTMGFVIQQNTS
jgi:hypothetical protein